MQALENKSVQFFRFDTTDADARFPEIIAVFIILLG